MKKLTCQMDLIFIKRSGKIIFGNNKQKGGVTDAERQYRSYKRDTGKNAARRLKNQGYIPAILYGKGMAESIPLAVEYNKLQRLLQKHGRNVLLNVIVDGSTHNAVIKEIQEDTLKGKIIHVDFQRVSMYEEIEATVPLKFEEQALLKVEVELYSINFGS